MELNREEIIKALECISRTEDVFCEGCTYRKYDGLACHRIGAKNALTLIKQLTEENERLKEKADRHLDNLKAVLDERAEQDVAREIDNLIRHIILNEDIAIKCKRENGEQNEEYWKGKVSAFRQIRSYIDAELRKKYIGE